MYILFKSIDIIGFKSIGNAHVDLDNCGIVKIKGINNLEDKTDSNGSGKSSIFESIIWALYGKTSKGVSNVVNIHSDTGCIVTLELFIDDVKYRVSRFNSHEKFGSGLSVIKYQDEEEYDLSGRNKTDTDKILQEIIGINMDLFLSIIFLSQGFNNRITGLGPSGRKSRIESLSGISDKVEKFKSDLSNRHSMYSTKERTLSNEVSNIKGQISVTERNINDFNNKIKKCNESVIYTDEQKKLIKSKYESFKSKFDQLNTSITNINFKLRELNNDKLMKTSQLSKINADICDLRNQIKSLECEGTCPVCGSEINTDKINELQEKYTNEINLLHSDKHEAEDSVKNLNSSIKSYSDKLNLLKSKVSEVRKSYDTYKLKYEESINDSSKELSIYQKSLDKEKVNIVNLNSDLKTKESEDESLLEKIGIIDNCSKIVTKKFRDYLLNQIIQFMNSRLEEYSKLLFSDKDSVIKISDKLVISINNIEYESLSGGEERKVDLALSLTQRDLALNISGIVSNIFILDEVLDNLDEVATTSALDMISSVSTEISSLFIISHNTYDIAYDNEIVVIKNQDGISEIASN